MLGLRAALLASFFVLSLACTSAEEPPGDGTGGTGGSGAAGGTGGTGGTGGSGGAALGGAGGSVGGAGGSSGTSQAGGTAGSAAGSSAGGAAAVGGSAGVPAGGSGGVAASGGAPAGGAGAGGIEGGGTGGDAAGMAGTTGGGGVGAAGAGAGGGAGMSGGTGGSAGSGMPGVRIVGRSVASAGGSRFGWPGVQVHARFSGTQASVQLNDAGYQNAFEVVVDGGTPKKFRTSSGMTTYPLATGLANGNHDVVLWRSTEIFDSGVTEFAAVNGFSSGGALLAPAAAPDRRIEIIGDSISAGAGLEGGASGCAADKNSTDNYFAYGSVAGRAVSADVVTIAYSGIGVYRSYNANDPTMPTRYDRTLPADTNATWDFSKFQPHVVVVNLGTNDFGAGDPGQPYVDAYVNFVKHVRSKYANAYFVCIAMYGNQDARVTSVVNTLKGQNESKIEFLSFNAVQNNLGCAQHPNAAAQTAMGNLLATRLRAIMSW